MSVNGSRVASFIPGPVPAVLRFKFKILDTFPENPNAPAPDPTSPNLTVPENPNVPVNDRADIGRLTVNDFAKFKTPDTPPNPAIYDTIPESLNDPSAVYPALIARDIAPVNLSRPVLLPVATIYLVSTPAMRPNEAVISPVNSVSPIAIPDSLNDPSGLLAASIALEIAPAIRNDPTYDAVTEINLCMAPDNLDIGPLPGSFA